VTSEQIPIDLKNLSLSQLEDIAEGFVSRRFPGRQVFGWIHKHNVTDFQRMTNVSKEFRSFLKDLYVISSAEIARVTESKIDGTRKLLLKLSDGELIETVWIPGSSRNTICVSSQVGCPLGCTFCFTGQMKMRRNLRPGEIAEQVYAVKSILKNGEGFQNIVFMGMGEPFLNYDNVIAGIELLANDHGLGIAMKRITISTVGIVPGIYRLADSRLKVRLAVSLHAADDDLRTRLVPVNNKYPLSDLMQALEYYTQQTGERLTFEYCLIGGVNDSIDCARRLIKLIHGIPCKINLICFNPADGLPDEYRAPSHESVERFREYLYPRCPAVTLRQSKGADIMAACGQLATHSQDSEGK
jgi:23S rRNA (adenine2503-C2)-methyltransferase